MSKKMILTAIACMSLFLTACVVQESKNDFKDWKNPRVTRAAEDGSIIPTDYVVDCRHIGDVENVHYYYSVIADPKPEMQYGPMGEKESVYHNADFSINYVSTSVNSNSGLFKGVVYLPVSFKIKETDKGDIVGVVTANEETMAIISNYYQENPYFSRIQLGDEILVLLQHRISNSFTNLTKVNIPGLTKGDSLECR